MTFTILRGDCIDKLRTLRDESVQCVMTSVPYWGLRDYQIPPSVWGGDEKCVHAFEPCEPTVQQMRTGNGLAGAHARIRGGGKLLPGNIAEIAHKCDFCRHCGAWRGALGLEPTYHLYVEHMVLVFREVWRVLRCDGTVWLNIGDCYATAAGASGGNPGGGEHGAKWAGTPARGDTMKHFNGTNLAKIRRGDFGTSSNRPVMGKHVQRKADNLIAYGPTQQPNRMPQKGLKAKDLVGIPWRVAFALQDDGWWLRQDIIWSKPNPMPESTRDRCTKAHEYIFLLAKSGRTLLWNHRDGRWVYERPAPDYIWRNRQTREESQEPQGAGWARINLWRGHDYYFDQRAIAEPAGSNTHSRVKAPDGWDTGEGGHGSIHRTGREKGKTHDRLPGVTPKSAPDDSMIRAKESWHASTTHVLDTRNKRSVWTIGTEAFAESHFATFPTALVEPCLKAGCPKGGVVLDCFGGAGTTALVAERLGMNSILIEINDGYADMAERRIRNDAPPLLTAMTSAPAEQLTMFSEAAE